MSGLNLANYNDIKVGDLIEAYEEVEVKKLSDNRDKAVSIPINGYRLIIFF